MYAHRRSDSEYREPGDPGSDASVMHERRRREDRRLAPDVIPLLTVMTVSEQESELVPHGSTEHRITQHPLSDWFSFIDLRGALRAVYLGAVFLSAFALSLWVVTRGYVAQSDNSSTAEATHAADLFPDALQAGSRQTYLRVTSHEGLDPSPHRDFLFAGWFAFRRVVKEGERAVLIQKWSGEPRNRVGYALALNQNAGVLRPILFWSTTKGGRWYKFSEISLEPGQWFMIALTVRDGHLLGMHLAKETQDKKIETALLGGYELDSNESLTTDADLLIAPQDENRFVGRVGRLLIATPESLSSNFNAVIKDLSRRIHEVPRGIDSRDVQLLWPPQGDDDGGRSIARVAQLAERAKTPPKQ